MDAPVSLSVAPPRGARLAGVRVLVAEDNRVNQAVIEYMLTAEGAEVALADNGAEAVARVKQEDGCRYDLVLMDIQMPAMDGFEATRAILEVAPNLPIVAQTAHAFDQEKEKCTANGMVDFLAKPIDLEQLVRVVQRHTSQSGPLRSFHAQEGVTLA